MFRFAFALWGFILCLDIGAQDFQHRQYRVANGLPSDVIKSVAQDTLGYFWIATDDGLVKYDGTTFTTYKHALHSQYAKGFLLTRNGRLLHYGDLDLIEIQNYRDTVIFKSIRRGARNPTDSMLWYPKSIFEDKAGNIWMGEPQSVVRISDNDMVRFEFPLSERSPQFLRSFAFFEDPKGRLYTVSYFGHVYRFNESNQVFEELQTTFPTDVGATMIYNGGLFIAALEGLYLAEFTKKADLKNPVKIVSIPNATDVRPYTNDKLIVTSAGRDQLLYQISSRSAQVLPITIANANMSYVSSEGDMWLASTEGLNLLQQNAFRKAGDENSFIESIAEDKKGNVYFCTMRYLYQLNEQPSALKAKLLLDIPRGYFQSILVNENGLWAANSFSLLLLQNNKVVKQWNLEQEGRFIHDLFEDSQHNIWLSQAGNNSVSCLLPDFTLKKYSIPLAPESSVNAVREGSDGIYILANGVYSNLFFKPHKEESFKNISQKLADTYQSDFNITDMVYNSGALWLSTTEGLLMLKGGKIQRVNLGEHFTKLSVKNVKNLRTGQILFTNSYGLFRYDVATGDYWLYDESNGLASNTVTTRGLYVDEAEHVWVGTAKGLSYSLEPLINPKETLKPNIIEVLVNGVRKKFHTTIEAPFNSFVSVKVSSITFPENNIIYQYREVAHDTAWHTLQQNIMTLSGLKPGLCNIQFRARKNGGFSWSKTTSINIHVGLPFWREPLFGIAFIISVVLIAWISFSIAAQFNKKRRAHLEAVIAERTQELKLINGELSTRNTELDRFVYSASHDLSAPLKSLLGLVHVARKDNPGQAMSQYLDMMETSVKKLEDFIRDVTNYSRNARTEVLKTEIDLSTLVQSVLSDHRYSPGFESMEFRVNLNLHSVFLSDEMRLKIILNNLISNAIKFRWTGFDRKPYVSIEAEEIGESVQICVRDNGRGIPQDKAGKVFEMFYRGTDSIPGSGLGLYILKETVIKLGGTVSLKTDVGAGSAFTITIPKK